jgi:hypothetical protein
MGVTTVASYAKLVHRCPIDSSREGCNRGQRVATDRGRLRRVEAVRRLGRVETSVSVCIRRTLVEAVLHPVQCARTGFRIARRGSGGSLIRWRACRCWATEGTAKDSLDGSKGAGQNTIELVNEVAVPECESEDKYEAIRMRYVQSLFNCACQAFLGGAADSAEPKCGRREIACRAQVRAEEKRIAKDRRSTTVKSDDAIYALRKEHRIA